MHETPPKDFLIKRILWKPVFFLYLFLSACSQNENHFVFQEEQRKDLTDFLNNYLFVEGAVYTLFGDKPITAYSVFLGRDEDYGQPEPWEDSVLVEDYSQFYLNVWKPLAEKLPCKDFRFGEVRCPSTLFSADYIFVNVEKFKEVMQQHQTLFDQRICRSYDWQQALEELKNPHSVFWKRVLKDQRLMGLLFGFGEENVDYFMQMLQKKTIHRNIFSDKMNHSATPNNFSLPIFALSRDDRTTEKYRLQREKIREIYRNKDIVDVTLRELTR